MRVIYLLQWQTNITKVTLIKPRWVYALVIAVFSLCEHVPDCSGEMALSVAHSGTYLALYD